MSLRPHVLGHRQVVCAAPQVLGRTGMGVGRQVQVLRRMVMVHDGRMLRMRR
jgi:hypothetical protein